MIFWDMRLPRELEADGTAGDICQVLMARTVQLSSCGDLSVPMITMGDPLKKVLQRANLNGQIRWGLEAISHKLAREKRGIDHLREGKGSPQRRKGFPVASHFQRWRAAFLPAH